MGETVEQIGERVAYEYAAYRGEEGGCPYLRVLIGRALTAERQRTEALEAELAHFKDPAMAPSQRYWEGRWRDEEKRTDELAAHNAVLREALKAMQRAWLDYHDRHSMTEPVTGRAGNAMDDADAALSTTPAASLDALTQRVRAEAMESLREMTELAEAHFIKEIFSPDPSDAPQPLCRHPNCGNTGAHLSSCPIGAARDILNKMEGKPCSLTIKF